MESKVSLRSAGVATRTGSAHKLVDVFRSQNNEVSCTGDPTATSCSSVGMTVKYRTGGKRKRMKASHSLYLARCSGGKSTEVKSKKSLKD